MQNFIVILEQINGVNYQNIIYILLALSLLTLVLLYFVRWRDYILPYIISKQDIPETGSLTPNISVILPTSDDTVDLYQHICHLLEQDYPNFEIVVVDESSSEEVKNVIERLQLKFNNVRYTFIPNSATNICKRKLAITLGIKAARAEWTVITTTSAIPQSKKWLRTLSRYMTDKVDFVLGYTNYENDSSSHSSLAILEKLLIQLRCYRSVYGFGAIGAEETNFCVRKSTFLENKGYANRSKICLGESHLLVDALGTRNNVRIVCSPDAIVRETLPHYDIWKNMQIYYREILHYSSRKVHFYLLREGFGSILNYFFFLISICYILVRALQLISLTEIDYIGYALDFSMLLIIITYIILPINLLRKTTALFGEQQYGMGIIWFNLKKPLINLSLKHKRWRLRKSIV